MRPWSRTGRTRPVRGGTEMEILLVILVVAFLLLWREVDSLGRAARSARADVVALRAETSRLRAAVAELEFAASAPRPTAADRAAARAARAEAAPSADL